MMGTTKTTAQKISAAAIAAFLVCIAGCSPSEGSGVQISREEAVQIVLDEVIGSADNETIVARIWHEPLSTGAIISNEFADEGEGRESAASEWFVWIDDAPLAFYSHSARYVYVDGMTGAVEVEKADEAPALNGSSLWETEEDFDDQSCIIFDNIADSFSEMAAPGYGLTSVSLAAGYVRPADNYRAALNENDQADQCCKGKGKRIALILYNFDNGPLQKDITDNVNGMAEALAAHKFTVPQFNNSMGYVNSSTGKVITAPAIYLGDPNGRGLKQLRDFVKEYSGPEHCCDEIFIYYTGHGKAANVSGQMRYYFGTRFNYRGEADNRSGQNRLYAEDFAEILSGLGSCHIQVVIDACHAGGFISALSGVKGVETVRVSVAANELAWGGDIDGANGGKTPDPYGRAQGEKGSEFTSGYVKGLKDRAAAMTRYDAPIPAGELTDVGFTAALANDIAAIAGKTHPTGYTRIKNVCDCCEDNGTDTGEEGIDTALGTDVQDVAVRFAITTGDFSYLPLPKENVVLHSNAVYTVIADGATDMTGVGKAEVTISEELYEQLFGSTDFPCGEGSYGLTMCPEDAVQETGSYYLVAAEFSDDVPYADVLYYYQIGFVFDSDGDPSNNYQPAPSWPADFFKDTDRWYVAEYAPGSGWTMSVSNAGSYAPAASGARIIINGTAVVLVLPASEIPSSQASFRITAFRHDGSYGMSGGFWNADLSTAVDQPMLRLE
jgi:hypothetical protein